MRTRQPFVRPERHAVRFDPNVDDVPWVTEGIFAGLVGASTIAAFLLVLDFANGRPLWTPHALGAAFFTRAVPPPDTPVQPIFVAAYTLLHLSVFVIVGLVAARELFTGTRIPGAKPWIRSLVLSLMLFLIFEIGSFVVGGLVEPAVQQVVGVWRATFANVLAATAMGVFLRARGERLGLHPDPDS